MRGRKDFVDRLRTAGGPSHELLVLLDAHRVLTTGQMARASGAPERTTRYRLERLHRAGLVDCRRPGREQGSAPRHWWLRPAGARIVSGTAAADGKGASVMFAAHASAIAEVWLALREHGPAAGVRVTGWAADRAGWQEWEQPSGYGTPRRLTPDAVLQAEVDVDGQVMPTSAFVEVDLATMTQTQLREKLTRYLAYAADRAWVGRFPHCPPLLLLTTTGTRAAGFIRAAGKALRTADRDRRGSYDWAHQGLPYAAREDLVHSDALIVAACGLVRTPGEAVSDTCWLLPETAAATVSLAELLRERVTARARVAAHLATEAAESARRRQSIDLHDAGHDPRAVDLLGETAAEALEYLTSPTDDLLDAEPDLAEVILAWHDEPDHPDTVMVLRRALLQRHEALWAGQVRALLAATEHIAVGHPNLIKAAAQLQAAVPRHRAGLGRDAAAGAHRAAGGVLDPPRPVRGHAAPCPALADPPPGQRRAGRRRLRPDPPAGLRHLRHAVQRSDTPGDDHLDDPLGDPLGGHRRYPAHPQDYSSVDGSCYYCGGALIGYEHRHQVPTLPQRLADLRNRLP